MDLRIHKSQNSPTVLPRLQLSHGAGNSPADMLRGMEVSSLCMLPAPPMSKVQGALVRCC